MDRKLGGLITVAMLALAACNAPSAPPAAAAAPPSPTPPAAPQPASIATPTLETCKNVSETARILMGKRQDGAAMSDVMDAVVKTAPPAALALYQNMVVKAYEEPRMSVESNKQQMVEDFGNAVYLDCIHELAK